LGASWRLGDWSVQPAVRRYDEFTTRNATDPKKDQTYGEQWIADLDIGYDAQKILPGLKFNIGANNLFNSFPDRSADGSVGGVVKYSFNAPEGANGAYYYAQIGYDF
jgi:iron complex outermembrane receptor protein